MKLKYSKNTLNKIGQKYNLRFIVIYGSYARAEENKDSDLDVAIHAYNRIDLRKLLKLKQELTAAFSDSQGRRPDLDLVAIEDKDPLFVYQIMRDAELLYGNRHDFNNYQAFALRHYLFNRKIFDLEDILIEKALKNL